MNLRYICVVLTTRGNYAKMKSTMQAIQSIKELKLQVVVGGKLLDNTYDSFLKSIKEDGFIIDRELDYIEGDGSLYAVSKSAGKCTALFVDVLSELNPNIVIIIADRYEALSLAHASLCMNIHIAHLEGGEISGSIDERIRHAITKLSHIHFPSNKVSAGRLIKMGEKPDTIHVIGTPSLDQIENFDLSTFSFLLESKEYHCLKDVVYNNDGYIVVSQHPVVTEYGSIKEHYIELAHAIIKLSIPVIWILPNDDAMPFVLKDLLSEVFQDNFGHLIYFVDGMNLQDYLTLIFNAKCLVGNTSSGIRECAYLGVPVVNIGSRQNGRQRGLNVVDVIPYKSPIVNAIRNQIKHGHYESDFLYGSGNSGEKIAQILSQNLPDIEKTLEY